MEGDFVLIVLSGAKRGFLSTPSGWRATRRSRRESGRAENFYPRPPGGGRLGATLFRSLILTISIHALRVEGDLGFTTAMHLYGISIHALRVEGDRSVTVGRCVRFNFYPRPPGGGRPTSSSRCGKARTISIHALRVEGDITTDFRTGILFEISIHALRVEGDPIHIEASFRSSKFLSTPSGWRATPCAPGTRCPARYFYPRPPGGGRRWQRRPAGSGSRISIHALRVEGDILPGAVVDTVLVISIHALRVEGDQPAIWIASVMADFYPRPPGGGRLPGVLWPPPALAISIHALRVEGDARSAGCQWCLSDFYPRPPGGGRPSRFGDSTPMYCLFLSTPSGWRATLR